MRSPSITRCQTLMAAILATVIVTACGGGRSNPVAPSVQPASPTTSGFGTLSVDVARCFQFVGDPACFSGARVGARGVTSAAAAPTAPSGLTASASGSTVTLTWLAPTGTDPATSYIIEAGSGPGLANLANFSTGSSATTFSAGGVPAGSYYVRVRASNSSGVSAPSNEALLVVGGSGPGPCTAAPGAPGGLTIATNSGGTVVLTWTAASGSPTTYIVEAGSAPGASNLVTSDLGGTTPSLTATGVGAGTYYVRIRAKNACGTGSPSNEVTLVVGTTQPGGSLTGRWIGVAPDGVIFNVPAARDTTCDDADDLQLDLTQAGTALTGTITLRTRSARTPPNCSGETVAGTATLANGSAVGTGVSFQLGIPPKSLTFSGVVSGNRMSGVAICGGDGSQCATFAATRQ